MIIKKLKSENITLNYEKSSFFKEEITYLGSIISKNSIKADISRINLYLNFLPKNKKNLMKLITPN